MQDLDGRQGSNWGWLYAYVTRFPDHENVKRLQQWSSDSSNLNSYQAKIVLNFENISKRKFGTSSWTVVEPNCHFIK